MNADFSKYLLNILKKFWTHWIQILGSIYKQFAKFVYKSICFWCGLQVVSFTHQKLMTYNNLFWGLYIYLLPCILNFQIFLRDKSFNPFKDLEFTRFSCTFINLNKFNLERNNILSHELAVLSSKQSYEYQFLLLK